jgi:acyl-CoA thioesterase
MTKFDAETALQPVGPHVYEGRISPDWSIVRGANGGHLAAILLRGMQRAVDEPGREPRSLSVHFARVPKDEPFTVETTIERTGRTVSNVSARMMQNGKLIVLGIGIFSNPRAGPDFSDLSMPEVAPPDAIDAVVDREDFPFGRQFDFRPALGDLAVRSVRAELGVWMRLREHRRVDHLLATQLLDAFAPAVFTKLGQGGGGSGVPTVEMTYHYRESLPLPSDEPGSWHLGLFRTLTSRGGFIEEDGWLWSRDGTLIAQARQLAILGT